ncbi:MAG TPA: alpha/beta hydrolase [Chloroflexota bacterium]|nr:alpha/beta hydrolase [Chloroflexota bacterium]
MPWAEANGATLYYETRGAGDPVLFLNATGWPLDVWELSCLPALAEQFQTIALDWRGVGRSTWAPGPYSTELFAEDVVGLLDALGVERAHLFAMSMGGRVAQHVALRWPERVRSQVLIATGVGRGGAGGNIPLDVALALGERGWWGYWQEHLDQEYTFTPEFRAAHPERIEALRQAIWAHRPPLALYLEQIDARLRHNIGDRACEIAVPTLVLVSRGDRVSRASGNNFDAAHRLAAAIPGAELAIVEGGRHLFLWEVPEQVTPVVALFFARH